MGRSVSSTAGVLSLLVLVIDRLFLYPVKSLGGCEVSELPVGPRGAALDRCFMLVDDKRRMLTQRQLAAMCLLTAKPSEHEIVVEARDGRSFAIPRDPPGEAVETVARVHGIDRPALAGWPEASLWFSEMFERKLHFVRAIDERSPFPRFTDRAPLLVVAKEAVDRLAAEVGVAVDPARFRPNVVVTGGDAAFVPAPQALTGSEGSLDWDQACTRCRIIDVDPRTAARQPKLLEHLSRREGTETAVFGAYVVPTNEMVLRVGQTFAPHPAA